MPLMNKMSSLLRRTFFIRTKVRPQGQGEKSRDGDVPGPVADHGESLFIQSGEHKLPFGAGRKGLQGLRIDDFRDEMVLVNMQAVLAFAFRGNPRPHDFTHAVVVGRADEEAFFDFFAHGFRPRFPAEEPELQRERFGVDPLLLRGSGPEKGHTKGC